METLEVNMPVTQSTCQGKLQAVIKASLESGHVDCIQQGYGVDRQNCLSLLELVSHHFIPQTQDADL
jgi:hypothetical protein